MELNREHFFAIIIYNFRRGITQQPCIDELRSIFGNEPNEYHIYRWYGEFNRGRSSLQDKSQLLILKPLIDAVRQLILRDRQVTYRQIDTTLGIRGTSIHSILHEHLTVKKNVGVGSRGLVGSVLAY